MFGGEFPTNTMSKNEDPQTGNLQQLLRFAQQFNAKLAARGVPLLKYGPERGEDPPEPVATPKGGNHKRHPKPKDREPTGEDPASDADDG